MAKSLEDLEETLVLQAEPEDEFEEDAEERSDFDDLLGSVKILEQCVTLLNYVSNPDLCKTVTMRERKNMAKFAVKIVEFIDSLGLDAVEDEAG